MAWFLRFEAIPPVATCFIINAVALLDEALELFIRDKFQGQSTSWTDTSGKRRAANSFGGRIDFLDRFGRLLSASTLRALKTRRNEYAHESGKYGDWRELDQVLAEIDTELRHLGIT